MLLKFNSKTLLKLMAMLMIAFTGLTFAACGGDDDDDEPSSIPSGLIGTWYGSGTRTEITVTFKSDGTGMRTYETPSLYKVAAFTYKVSGSKVTCNGTDAKAYSNGDSETVSWKHTYTYNGSTLSDDESSNVPTLTKK